MATDPAPIAPMLLRAGPLPADRQAWVYELKWDGYRALVRADRSGVEVWSRNGNRLTGAVPELVPLGRALGGRAVLLDGELVAFGDDGHPSFERLQSRMRGAAGVGASRRVDPPRAWAARRAAVADKPVFLVAFDLLLLDGAPLMDLPWSERRARLDALAFRGDHWSTTDVHADGAALLAATRRAGLEGVVAKRPGSRYRPGRRTPDWVKVKNWLVRPGTVPR